MNPDQSTATAHPLTEEQVAELYDVVCTPDGLLEYSTLTTLGRNRAVNLARAAFDLGVQAAKDGEGWEVVTEPDDISKGDKVELRMTCEDGTVNIDTFVAHHQGAKGEWVSQWGYGSTSFTEPNATHRVRRAPRLVLPTEPGVIIRDVNVDGHTCKVMLRVDEGWSGTDQGGTRQWWLDRQVRDGQWRPDRGEKEED